jgi:thiamine transport system permease protein
VTTVDLRPAGGSGLARAGRVAVIAIPVGFLLVLFVYPLATIVVTGLVGGRGIAPKPFVDIVTAPGLRGVLWFTVWQAVVSTGLTLLVGLPGAYVFARLDFPGRSVLRAAVTVPFVLPTVVVAAAFTALLGSRSPFGGVLAVLGVPGGRLTGTIWAVLIAHVFFNYAVVIRTVGGLWSHLDPRTEEAARTLGASPWQVFREVTLPLLRPAIAAAAAIVFLFTFTSFGVVLLLGGPRLATVEVEIYRATAQLLDLRTAAVLALVQLIWVVAALLVYGRLRRTRAGRQQLATARRTAHRPRGGERALLGANLAVMALLLGTPLAVLVERSFRTAEGYGLTWYLALGDNPRGSLLFVPPWEAVANSLGFATVATAIALVVGGCAAVVVTARRRGGRSGAAARVLDTVLMLPLGTSAVTIGFGFLIALDRPPLDLRGSVALVPLAQALVAVPFVVRLMVPVIEAIDARLREAAATLGAPPWRVWREIDLPIVTRALTVAAGFAFAVSLGEFGATVFLARADRPTVPVAIFRLLGQPGAANLGQAMALSTILMVLTAAAMLAIERFRARGVGEF